MKPGKKPSPFFSERLNNARGFIYVLIKVPPAGNWVLKHRWMMEQHLGRKLTRSEIVHHKDENTLNNAKDLSNFEIVTRKNHAKIHLGCNRWSRNYDAFIVC